MANEILKDLNDFSLKEELKKFEEKGTHLKSILMGREKIEWQSGSLLNEKPIITYIKKMSKQYRYQYSFAELLDRAGIVLMKIANSPNADTPFHVELKDILHDIQLHLNEKPMTAEMVRGLIVLTQVNFFIWGNEKAVRDADDGKISDEELIIMLKESHKANSLRGEAKKHIQLQRGSRTDEKLNYGRTAGFWNIKF